MAGEPKTQQGALNNSKSGSVSLPISLRRPSDRGRLIWCAGLLVFSLVTIVASGVVLSLDFKNVVDETRTVLERGQVAAWIIVGLIAAVGCLKQSTLRGVFLLWLLAVMAMLAGLRELDFQVLVNPENIGMLGLDERVAIRWKPSWWMDPGLPIGVKLAWGAVLAVCSASVLVPFGLSRYPWPTRLAGLRLFAWLPLIAGGMLIRGVFVDDAARGTDVGTEVWLIWVEETLELAGAVCFVWWAAWLGFGSPNLLLDAERELWDLDSSR
jgi:hypothetical protein